MNEKELQVLEDFPSPTPTPGGEYEPPYVEEGGKECKDEGYFISVCETGFVDPVLRHTIVEASATLHDCQVCVTAAEVRAAVDAINELLALADSEYSMEGSDQTSSSHGNYQSCGGWQETEESSGNSDYSNDGETLTCNASGSMRMSCGVGVRCSSGTSSCSVRLMRKGVEEEDFSPVLEETENTNALTTTVIHFTHQEEVEEGDQYKVEYRNNEEDNPHSILGEDSYWDVIINKGIASLFS